MTHLIHAGTSFTHSFYFYMHNIIYMFIYFHLNSFIHLHYVILLGIKVFLRWIFITCIKIIFMALVPNCALKLFFLKDLYFFLTFKNFFFGESKFFFKYLFFLKLLKNYIFDLMIRTMENRDPNHNRIWQVNSNHNSVWLESKVYKLSVFFHCPPYSNYNLDSNQKMFYKKNMNIN